MGSSKLVVRAGSVLIVLLLGWSGLHADGPQPDATTADGGRYYGPLVNGLLQGHGRLERSNGDRYVGEFAAGLFSGTGRLQYGSGEVYEGEFRDGMPSGQGRLQMIDGSVYVGTFRNGYFNGSGRYEADDGALYEGAFENGRFDGAGRLRDDQADYSGQFQRGRYWGRGELAYPNGTKYRGEFVKGRMQGKGRYETASGEIFEGDFDKGEFTGTGTYSRKDNGRHEGEFRNWRPHGQGRYTTSDGDAYEGKFVDGQLEGVGKFTGSDGLAYVGEFKGWRFHGQGELRLANGDRYKGGFAGGLYEGEGTLTYAKPRADGSSEQKGIWRYGSLADQDARQRTARNVEAALYNQRRVLDAELARLKPSDPGKINLYLLAVAGDGSQEVFRREVEFVREQFSRDFGTEGRAVALINSRNTVETAPMATVTSIRETLLAIARRMDKERDILFLYLSSHGSREHELVLDQNGMDLRGLRATELAKLLDESGIRWRAIIVSACYSGGFIGPLKNDHTLVITAARHDRTSFGCADENDFTYFGEAFFKEALPRSSSFQDAFAKADQLVRERELADHKDSKEGDPDYFSLPQMHNPAVMQEHLKRWWAQSAQRVGAR